jgi:hypothetical protein
MGRSGGVADNVGLSSRLHHRDSDITRLCRRPLPLAVVIIGFGALRWWLSKTNRPAPPRDGDDDRHDQPRKD